MSKKTNILFVWKRCIGTLILCFINFIPNTLFAQQNTEIKTILSSFNNSLEYKGVHIFSDSLMPLIYERKDYQPIWTSENNIDDLLYVINDSYNEGLVPEHYHLEQINKLRSYAYISKNDAAFLDILMTDAAILLSSHLIWGKVNPEKISSTWNFDTKEFSEDRISLFLEPIEQEQIIEAVEAIKPSNSLYLGLKKSLKEFRKIEKNGGYGKLQRIESIRIGEKNESIPALRKRLAVTQHLKRQEKTVLQIDTTYHSQFIGLSITDAPLMNPKVDSVVSYTPFSPIPIIDSAYVKVSYLDTTSFVYDNNLRKSIIHFQSMYGLETDGNVGKNTLKALNIPPSQRINTLRINLERARWVNHEDDDNVIFVNIASYMLYLHKNGKWYYRTNVVVGKPYHQTPVFKAKMSYIDINPTWSLPYSIASEEMLPKLKKDPTYLEKHNMKLYDRKNKEIDPTTVKWKTIKKTNFPYYIVQGSGSRNALGQIKFMFPNKYSIYLHDTPSRYLFNKNSRAFSHGCIRVHNPLNLGEQLLKDQGYTLEDIKDYVDEGELKRIIIMDRPTVYLLYFTAMLGPDTAIHFHDDIYDRDERVLVELNKALY